MTSQLVTKFRPLMNRVLVQKLSEACKTASGIFLPQSLKGATHMAKVIAVGSGSKDHQTPSPPMIVKEGDTVVIPDYGGTPIQLGQEEFLLFQNKDLLGIVDQ